MMMKQKMKARLVIPLHQWFKITQMFVVDDVNFLTWTSSEEA
jgi:hypothetical protein